MVRSPQRLILLSAIVISALLLGTIPSAVAKKTSHLVFSAWSNVQPTINGNLDPGEWRDADHRNLELDWDGMTHKVSIYVKNDLTNLYLAVKISKEDIDPDDLLEFIFDCDNDGVFDAGDDRFIIGFPVPWLGTPGTWFKDCFYCYPDSLSSTWDTLDPRGPEFAGTNDGLGRFTHTNMTPTGISYELKGTYVFEMSHPLDSSDDEHDFSLSPGDSINFRMLYTDNLEYPTNWPTSPAMATIIVAEP